MTLLQRAPALALALLTLVACTAARAGEPTPRDRQAARCVAALEASADALALEVKAGREAARKPLFDRLLAGAAFVGDSFLHGNSSESQARALVDAEARAQRSLPAAELAARQASCAAEGARLLAASNPVERAVVRRLARKRMDRLLAA